VQYATQAARRGVHDAHEVPVGFAVVKDHRQIKHGSQRQLARQHRPLRLPRRQVVMVVQPDLADRHHTGLPCQCCQASKALLIERDASRGAHRRGRLVRVNADGSTQSGIAPGDGPFGLA